MSGLKFLSQSKVVTSKPNLARCLPTAPVPENKSNALRFFTVDGWYAWGLFKKIKFPFCISCQELLASDWGVCTGSFGHVSGTEKETFLGFFCSPFCTPGVFVDAHAPGWSPPSGGSIPTAIAVGVLGAAFAAGWLGAAGAAGLRPAAFAAPGVRQTGEYCCEYGYLWPHLFSALAAYPQLFPHVGVRHAGAGILDLLPPCTAAAEGVCYSMSRRGYSTI